MVSAGLLTANPFQTVGGLPRADILPACLSEEAVRSRLAAMPKTKLIEHRDYVIALLMLRTGIRETELCEVSVADVLPVGDAAFRVPDALRPALILRDSKQHGFARSHECRIEQPLRLAMATENHAPIAS